MQLATVTRPALPADALLVDDAVATFDARIAEHRIIDADVATTWDALVALDLMRVHTPLLDAAFWARGLPAKLRRREVAPPPAIVLGAGDVAMPGWLQFGIQPGHEIALGAIGRFWTPTITWHEVADAEEFRAFTEPGWGKIGVSFSVRAYGGARSLLTYECRTATTDDCSRDAFRWYWRLVRPFVGHIMRATVRQVALDATS